MKNKIRFIHKTISFTLIILMLFIPVLSAASLGTTTTAPMGYEKLTESLKAHLETVEDDEYVPIYIWLDDYGEDVFYQALSKRLGVNITEQTEEAYISSKVAEKVQLFEENLELMKADTSTYGLQTTEAGEIDIKSFSPMLFRAKASISDTMTDTEIQNCLNSGMSSKEIINLSERHQYLKDYRQTRKLVNTTATQEFSRLLDLSKCKNVYLSEGLTFLSVECKKSYINTIAINPKVESVDLVVDVEFATLEVEETPDASTYGAIGNNYQMNDQYTYDGSGIKIGVLEVEDAKSNSTLEILPDLNNIYLSGMDIITNVFEYESEQEITTSDHATKVIAIAGGKEYVHGGVTYNGVAPNATIYYTNLEIYTSDSANTIPRKSRLEKALDWLVSNNVSVISMSFAIFYKDEALSEELGETVYQFGAYQESDRILDAYINNYRVICVVAAGNSLASITQNGETVVFGTDWKVTNPALSYNSISVGNATANGKINETSCYIQGEGWLANKPDLSAPGTNIYMPRFSSDDGNLGLGTSWSAPQVAGAAALVMQANTDLIGSPDTVKAILLGSADENAISAELDSQNVEQNPKISSAGYTYNSSKIENPTTNLRKKSGAGLLNIEAALRMATSNLFYTYSIYYDEVYVTEKYHFDANTSIEFGIVFEKPDDELITNTISNEVDVEIIDSSNNVIFSSQDVTNNVEIFSCKIKTSGDYRFRILKGFKEEINTNVTFFLACACSEKMLAYSGSAAEYNTISCGEVNCGFTCQEKFRQLQITKNVSAYGVSINFSAYYLPQKYSKTNFTEFDYWSGVNLVDYMQTPAKATIFAVVVSQGNTQPTSTGEIITKTYAIIGETAQGNDIYYEISVVATIDYFEQTVVLS